MTTEPDTRHSIVLYDGVCRLCQGSVRFIAERDPQGHFRFASLQSRVSEAMLHGAGVTDEAILCRAGVTGDGQPATIVLIEGGRAYTRSTAALRIARRLRFPWNALAAGLIVPRPIRDAVYGWVARRRYGWFGRTDVCDLPPPEWRDRFLDAP